MAELRRVSCNECGQTFLSTDVDRCSLCGKAGGIVDSLNPGTFESRVARRDEARPQIQAPDTLVQGVGMALLGYRLLKLFGGGLVMLAIGVWMMFDPNLRSDPRRLSVSDLAVALGPILAGLVLIGFGIYHIRRYQRETRSPQATSREE